MKTFTTIPSALILLLFGCARSSPYEKAIICHGGKRVVSENKFFIDTTIIVDRYSALSIPDRNGCSKIYISMSNPEDLQRYYGLYRNYPKLSKLKVHIAAEGTMGGSPVNKDVAQLTVKKLIDLSPSRM